MKNKCKILVVLTLVIVFLFYRFDSVVAMANVRFNEFDIEIDENAGTEQIIESAAGSGAEQSVESVAESESEQSVESAAGSSTEQIFEPAFKSDSEQNVEPAIALEPEYSSENVAESETESTTETDSVSEPETEPTTETDSVSEPETEPAAETAPVSVPTPDYISTGSALIDWLESHKNTGGLAKLTDNVVLDGYYDFCPCGINMPSFFVDTDKYTITIAGDIELLSDAHLTFSGHPDGKGIFYVAPKGMLSISGIAVESGQCALWQEEGAGLVIEDCHISGDIHYADTPFVMYENSICAVVEKGQTLNDVLPTQLICEVNSHGDLSNNPVPVSWTLEGTEKQQKERLRFQIQGSFVHAASFKELFCTVVYNDYPLTFTDMEVSLCYNAYLFLGGYTKPEECLPITVKSEYSFDGENWIMYEENIVSNVHASFVLCLEAKKWDTAAYPNIYIRQQWNDNGTIYFSNVLCYAADNLECGQDMGGSRGGGTSITNPPAKPLKSSDEPSSSNYGSGKAKSDTNQNTNVDQSSNTGTQNTNADQSLNTGSQTSITGQSLYLESKSADAGNSSYSEIETDNSVRIANGSDNKESINNSDSDASEKEKETAAALSAYEENSGNLHPIKEQTLRSGISGGNNIVIAIAFVVLSAIAGIVGFCAHTGIFRSQFYAVKRALFK